VTAVLAKIPPSSRKQLARVQIIGCIDFDCFEKMKNADPVNVANLKFILKVCKKCSEDLKIYFSEICKEG
jgi:hypothetical protein